MLNIQPFFFLNFKESKFKMFKKYTQLSLITVTLYSITANAQVEYEAILSGVNDAEYYVLLVGASVVLVVLGVKVYKWIARSL